MFSRSLPINARLGKYCVAAALSAPMLPFAQSALARQVEPRGYSLEEMVVTARRREESAQDVPLSITALDAGALENFNIENLDELQ